MRLFLKGVKKYAKWQLNIKEDDAKYVDTIAVLKHWSFIIQTLPRKISAFRRKVIVEAGKKLRKRLRDAFYSVRIAIEKFMLVKRSFYSELFAVQSPNFVGIGRETVVETAG